VLTLSITQARVPRFTPGCYHGAPMDWDESRYRFRLGASSAASLLLHALLLLWFLWSIPSLGLGPDPVQEPESIKIRFAEQPEPTPKQLVETVEQPPAPPPETVNIARNNMVARDMMLQEGDEAAPIAFEEDIAPSLSRPVPQQPTVPAPPVPPAPEPEERQEAPEPEQQQPEDREPPERPALPVEPPAREEPPERPEDEPIQMAQAATAPPQEKPPSQSRGPVNGRVENKGFTSFQALRDEIAPYLESIQQRVELRWSEMLRNYPGVEPRAVELDCEIGKDGKLVRVEIIDDGGDRIYAAICTEAIRKAAPFAPFPFEVPAIYSNQNLEIRWRFSFL